MCGKDGESECNAVCCDGKWSCGESYDCESFDTCKTCCRLCQRGDVESRYRIREGIEKRRTKTTWAMINVSNAALNAAVFAEVLSGICLFHMWKGVYDSQKRDTYTNSTISSLKYQSIGERSSRTYEERSTQASSSSSKYEREKINEMQRRSCQNEETR